MPDTHIAYHALVRPRALAMITPNRRVSYAQLDADINRFAAAFRALGIGPETGVVSFETLRIYRYYVALMALARLGVAAGVAADALCELKLSDQPGATTERIRRLTPDWFAAVEAAEPIPISSAPRDPDRPGRVLLSSGTTKAPRRVPTTWRQRLERIATSNVTDARGRLGVWAMQPGFDSGLGYGHALLGWTLGVAVAAGFSAAELVLLLERHPEGVLGLTPAQLQSLLDVLPPGFEPRPDWRVIMSGAALSQTLAREARARLTPDILVSYGATEIGRIATGPATLLESTPGAVGWPGPGTCIEVVDENDHRVPIGEQGILRIRASKAGTTYLDNDAASETTFRNGFVYPGDLGRQMPAGFFVVDGRVDERLNVHNVKIMPDLLENALRAHPEVNDVAAYAVPDAQGLDQCWIAVVSSHEIAHDSLMACLQAVHPTLPPIHFAKTPEIPRSARGKIDRDALRAQTTAALDKKPLGST